MKKLFLILALAIATLTVTAQNLQLHYDFGRDVYSGEEIGRQKVTATFEVFKADKLGSWFYFIDMDFNRKGVISSYMEASREFNLGANSPFAAHIEYNGGLNSDGIVFQPAALVGGAWNGHNADYSATYSVQLLYKQFFKGYNNRAYASVQLTGVWGLKFANDKLSFNGFIDFWRGEKANGHGMLVIITEPQLWYNFSSKFSVGTELEISNNFIFNTDPTSTKSFFVNPTLGLKWEF